MHPRRPVVASVACLAALATVATTAAAAPARPASEPSPPAAGTVIYSSDPAPEPLLGINIPLDAASRDGKPTEFRFPASEPAFVPNPGETITVVYTDAVTTYSTGRSGCTQTSTAGRPYVNANYARAATSFSRSAGCVGNIDVVGALEWRGGAFNAWNRRGTFVFPALRPGNGVSTTIRANDVCGAGSGTWRSMAFFGSVPAAQSISAETALSCRG